MNTSKLRKAIEAEIAALQVQLAKLDEVEALEKRFLPTARPKVKTIPDMEVAFGDAPILPDNGTSTLPFPEKGSYQFTRAIVEALDAFKGSPKFTRNDVLDLMRKLHPTATVNETSVSSHLWKMKESGELVLVTKGHGKKPSEYAWPHISVGVPPARKTANGNELI